MRSANRKIVDDRGRLDAGFPVGNLQTRVTGFPIVGTWEWLVLHCNRFDEPDSRRCGRITRDLLEGTTVNNSDMAAVAELDNSARGQVAKRSADRRKRDSDVFTNVRTVHRQVDFSLRLASGNFEFFD